MLTQSALKSQVHYDPKTGLFTWAVSRRGVRLGAECGRVNVRGYREIGIFRVLRLAHRLAFLYMVGRQPAGDVDHINGDGADNRWLNLREATATQNAANTGARRNNTSGIPGVVWDHGRRKWRAQIRIGGKKTNLGRFDDPDDARRAVDEAGRAQWGEFYRR